MLSAMFRADSSFSEVTFSCLRIRRWGEWMCNRPRNMASCSRTFSSIRKTSFSWATWWGNCHDICRQKKYIIDKYVHHLHGCVLVGLFWGYVMHSLEWIQCIFLYSWVAWQHMYGTWTRHPSPLPIVILVWFGEQLRGLTSLAGSWGTNPGP